MQSFRCLLVELPAKCLAFNIHSHLAIGERQHQHNDQDKRSEAKKKEAPSRHGNSRFLAREALRSKLSLTTP